MKKHLKQPTRYFKKFKIKKNDQVIILSGDFKGKVATVSSVDKENDKVALEGLPKLIRHIKPSQLHPSGKIEKLRTVHISNVSLYADVDGKNTPSKVRIEKKDNKKIRVLKKTNKEVESNV